MEQEAFSTTLRRLLARGRHWAWLLALSTLLAGGSAYIISRQISPVYQASTLLRVNEAPGTQAIDLSVLQTSERLTKTYAEIFTTRPVLEGVMECLKLDLSIEELRERIKVQPVRDTQLIWLHINDTDPARAADIANALYAVFDEQNRAFQSARYTATIANQEAQLSQLEKQIGEAGDQRLILTDKDQVERDRVEALIARYQASYSSLLQKVEDARLVEAQTISSVVQMEAAVIPATPVRPRVPLNTVAASLIGLMLGIGIVFLIETLDDTFREPEDVARELHLPVLGMIARHTQVDSRPIAAAQPRSQVAEAFRTMQANIRFTLASRPLRSLLVTSPWPEEGKTTIAANLGVILAQNGGEVLLIDANLRQPRLHTIFGLSNHTGVSSLFAQKRVHHNGYLQKTKVDRLMALTSGPPYPYPSELLGSEKMALILKSMSDQAGMLIFDSPPVLAVADSTILAPLVDGVLLVVRLGVTRREACRQAIEQLRRGGANLLGVVLNDMDARHYRYLSVDYPSIYEDGHSG